LNRQLLRRLLCYRTGLFLQLDLPFRNESALRCPQIMPHGAAGCDGGAGGDRGPGEKGAGEWRRPS
jgi:hypothetical protein